jgi:DnaJ-class molecular chaperone
VRCSEPCRYCQGLGWVPASSSTLYLDPRPCVRCRGNGQVFWELVDDIVAYAARSQPTASGEVK